MKQAVEALLNEQIENAVNITAVLAGTKSNLNFWLTPKHKNGPSLHPRSGRFVASLLDPKRGHSVAEPDPLA
jgi:hypothetical protein